MKVKMLRLKMGERRLAVAVQSFPLPCTHSGLLAHLRNVCSPKPSL